MSNLEPPVVPNHDIVLSNCYIAHMDILGSRAILEGDDDGIVGLIRSLEDICTKVPCATGFSFKVYSDNMMLYTYDCTSKMFENLVESVAEIQLECILGHGLLIRGGISDKKIFSNEFFTIGKGLLEAYDLETKYARGPRVVLPYGMDAPSKKHVSTDVDGFQFIDYLGLIVNELGFVDEGYIERHRSSILASLNRVRGVKDGNARCKAFKKHLWLIKYHNSFCTKHYIDYEIEEKCRVFCEKCAQEEGR